MTQTELHTVDLRTAVPADWTLTGLSTPRWDGVNYYRATTGPRSRLEFETPDSQFAQLSYQLYSPRGGVTGRVFLNGQVLDTFTFPKDEFVLRQVSGFTRPGKNVLTIDYLCGHNPCQGTQVRQYWTQLRLVPSENARRETGLGVQQWRLDAPQSPLSIRGTSPILFDGVNYFRSVESPIVTLGWPEGTRPLNVTFQVSGTGPFRVTARLDGKVILQKRGDEKTVVRPTLSLTAYPGAKAVQVQVDCLSRSENCARLYFTRASVIPPQVAAPPTLMTLLVAGGLVLLALLLLAWGLRLVPSANRVPG